MIGSQLDECPHSPNCVSTQTDQAKKKMLPLVFEIEPLEAMNIIKSVVLSHSDARLVKASPNHLCFTFTSRFMKYVDDVEFVVDGESNLIHFRSASRVGYSDLGANRRRMARLSEAISKGLEEF